METIHTEEPTINNQITVEDVTRLLEVGRLLFSVLKEDEIEELQELLSLSRNQIGNAGIS